MLIAQHAQQQKQHWGSLKGMKWRGCSDHVGEVANADTFEQAIKKVSDGIKKQTNQAIARFKKKIISEDLNFDDTVKYGLAMEQGAKKVNEATQSEKKMNV